MLSAVFPYCTVDPDLALRDAAIRHCRLLSQRWGDAVPASELKRGFVVGDRHVKLVAWGRGIFKRKELTGGPLTLVSSMTSRYEDMVFAPVSILGFDDGARKFRLGLAAAQADAPGLAAAPTPGAVVKAYAKTMVQTRLHQAGFREATLSAYDDQCAICELRERPLLDAAHIAPDRLPDSVPEVRNGLAMCPTHSSTRMANPLENGTRQPNTASIYKQPALREPSCSSGVDPDNPFVCTIRGRRSLRFHWRMAKAKRGCKTERGIGRAP